MGWWRNVSLVCLGTASLAGPLAAGEHGIDVGQPPAVDRWLASGSSGGFIGIRHTPAGPWADYGDALQVGLTLGIRRESWVVEPTISFFQAQRSGSYHEPGTRTYGLGPLGTLAEPYATGTVDYTLTEYAIGVRRVWRWGRWEPSVGGGPALVQVAVKRTPADSLFRRIEQRNDPRPVATSDQATAGGGWVACGLAWRLGGARLGVEGRYTLARTILEGERVDVGGLQAGGMLSIVW